MKKGESMVINDDQTMSNIMMRRRQKIAEFIGMFDKIN